MPGVTEHFVSFGETQQHDLHVAGEAWGSALKNWGQYLEGIRGREYNGNRGYVGERLSTRYISLMKFCIHE